MLLRHWSRGFQAGRLLGRGPGSWECLGASASASALSRCTVRLSSKGAAGGGRGLGGFDHFEKKRLQKGYFFELNEIRDTQGKIFPCTEGVIRAAAAEAFPEVTAHDADNAGVDLARDVLRRAGSGAVVGLYFRENAKARLRSWTEGFAGQGQLQRGGGSGICSGQGVQVVELCAVDSFLFRAGPLKRLLLQGLRGAPDGVRSFAAFGKLRDFQHALGISNRLTAYCFLVDGKGRVRWRGSGTATEEELGKLRSAAATLAKE